MKKKMIIGFSAFCCLLVVLLVTGWIFPLINFVIEPVEWKKAEKLRIEKVIEDERREKLVYDKMEREAQEIALQKEKEVAQIKQEAEKARKEKERIAAIERVKAQVIHLKVESLIRSFESNPIRTHNDLDNSSGSNNPNDIDSVDFYTISGIVDEVGGGPKNLSKYNDKPCYFVDLVSRTNKSFFIRIEFELNKQNAIFSASAGSYWTTPECMYIGYGEHIACFRYVDFEEISKNQSQYK